MHNGQNTATFCVVKLHKTIVAKYLALVQKSIKIGAGYG